MSDVDKNVEILALRHQLANLQCQIERYADVIVFCVESGRSSIEEKTQGSERVH